MAQISDEHGIISISPNDYVTATFAGNVIEVQYMEHSNNRANIKKIPDSNYYVVLSTGEVKEYKVGETRMDNFSGLRKTFKKLRYLINANFSGLDNELFITLTYKENMSDTKRLYEDFRKFYQRLNYHYFSLGKLEYINVIEYQERGALHCHVLLKCDNNKRLYIDHKHLSDLWGHGYVWVNRLKGIDDLGAYLSAYLTDIPLEDSDDIHGQVIEKNVDGKSKKIIKGGRLHLYPAGVNLYRKSKGIVMPERKKMKYKDVLKILGGRNVVMEKNIFIKGEDFEENKNAIRFEQYNLKRP